MGARGVGVDKEMEGGGGGRDTHKEWEKGGDKKRVVGGEKERESERKIQTVDLTRAIAHINIPN